MNAATRRFEFAFARSYRWPARVFGIRPDTAWVDVGPVELFARFGPWSMRTPLTNIKGATETGGFAFVKTAGPPHLSFTDRGVTFATNSDRALCVEFREPVRGIDPTGLLRHPGATFTVADPAALRSALGLA